MSENIDIASEEQREPRTLNSNEIQQIIPHRYPFLLVDRVVDYEPGIWAKGIKCVTANEQFFCGHFPAEHVMPGVLILEALAQVGAIAVLSLPENAGKTAYFGGVKKCRFKQKVVPGDVLELYSELIEQKGPVGFAKSIAKVDGKVTCSAELMFAIGN